MGLLTGTLLKVLNCMMTAQIDVYCNKDEGGHVCSVHVSVIYDFAWHDTTKLMCFERVGKGVPVCSLWNT